MAHDVRIAIRLPQSLADEIRRRARADDRSLSYAIRKLLTAQLTSTQTSGGHDGAA